MAEEPKRKANFRSLSGGKQGPKEGPKQAIALKYEPREDEAPIVVATGEGQVADFIVKLAEEHGVVIREDAPLAEALGQLKLGAVIPPELYQAVAEVLAYVYELDQHADKRRAVTRR